MKEDSDPPRRPQPSRSGAGALSHVAALAETLRFHLEGTEAAVREIEQSDDMMVLRKGLRVAKEVVRELRRTQSAISRAADRIEKCLGD